MSTNLGGVVQLLAYNVDVNGNPVDAGAVTCTVRQPDGTAGIVGVIEHQGVGAYYVNFTTVQPGRHVVHWLGTGANPFASVDPFNVLPADPRSLITIEDAKRSLGRDLSRSVNDDDLRLYIAAVTPIIEDITGPMICETRTQTFDGGGPALLLSGPCSAATVTESGTLITDYVLDTRNGIIYGGGQFSPRSFLPGTQNIVVAYSVGVAVTPPNVLLAVREELRFLVQIGQQSMHPGMGDDSTEMEYTPSGFAVPRRVMELCGPNPSFAGFA